MIIRAIDDDGDWEFGYGLTSYKVDQAAIEENIKTRLLSWKNDCFFSLQDFVDWRARLDVGQQNNLLNELKTVILASFGVVAVISIEGVFSGEDRSFDVNAVIQTIFSPSFQIQLTQAAGGS